MRLKKEDYITIEKAFIDAYRGKEILQPGEEWTKKVMADIQKHRPITASSANNYLGFLGQLAWQIASVACFLIGLLIILMFKVDFVLENEVAKISFEQPIEVSYIEIPGA
ncbi:MAG: hypothetical protein N3A64_04495 [Desulfobacterota bacterium]|nr:hypothetical protein [Thermodesulfobacteriota bacterium]